MTHRDIPVLNSTMHYVEVGEGDPIVFLHGNPTSSHLWRKVMPQMAARGRCLAPDLIGMGRSGKPRSAYRFLDHARYVEAWFDAMRLQNVTLVVHDWGSALGIYWARRYPERVIGIAMMEPILRDMPWAEFPSEFVDLFKQFRSPGAGETLVLEQNVFVEQVLPASVLRKLTAREMDAYRAPFPTPESRAPVLQWPRELPLDGQPADTVGIIEASSYWLAHSPIPKLLLTFDPGVLMTENAIQWCKATFRNLDIRRIGTGLHFVQEDHPEAIGNAIRAWRRKKVRKRK